MYFKSRNLKISSLITKPKWKKAELKPKLILQGDWMQKAGFQPGENINIEVHTNKLIITRNDR